jgi:sugar lactone lactonase YvrE
MRFMAIRVPVPLLLVIAAGCSSNSTMPSDPPGPPPPPELDGLWTASGSPSAILRFSPNQLFTSGNRDAATTLTTPSAQLHTLVGVAFDRNGTLWITSADDSLLLGFGAVSLTSSGSKTATVVIESSHGSLSAPTGLAFDADRRLWVANQENGTLVRYDPGQLAAGGAPTPAVVVVGLGHPTSLAFDALGTLWVSDNQAHTVSGFRPAQLAGSGSPAPAVVLSAVGSSLVNPAGLAFDASGNLWVANIGARTLVAFSPAQLASSCSPAPAIAIFSNVSVPTGLAFDGEGSLWVVGGTGSLTKFTSSSLATSGAPEPSVQFRVSGHSIFWSVAFWPVPAGLPLN